MDIFLLRHFESIKNTQVSFSSIDDKEELTDIGVMQGKQVANNLRMILELKRLTVKKIYCADSVRAKQSAELIATELSENVKVQAFRELLSTKSKDTIGKTREEVRKINPRFMRELSLYDAGIFNSYNFHREVGKMEKIEYEMKVCKCIERIIHNNEEENAKIICLHNSSLTAIVINIARELCQYPDAYYGKVIADNGKIFWIQSEQEDSNFCAANCDSKLLLDIIKEEMYASQTNY